MEALISLLSCMKGSNSKVFFGGSEKLISGRNLKSGFFEVLNSARNPDEICDVLGDYTRKSRNKKKNSLLQTAPIIFDSSCMKEILSPFISQMNGNITGNLDTQVNDQNNETNLETDLSISSGNRGKHGNLIKRIINLGTRENKINPSDRELKQLDISVKTLNGQLTGIETNKPDENRITGDLITSNIDNNSGILLTNEKTNDVKMQDLTDYLSGRNKQTSRVEISTNSDTSNRIEGIKVKSQSLQNPVQNATHVNPSVKVNDTNNKKGNNNLRLIPNARQWVNSKLEFKYTREFKNVNHPEPENVQGDPEISISNPVQKTTIKEINHPDEVTEVNVKTHYSNELSPVSNAENKDSEGVRMPDLIEKLSKVMTRYSSSETNKREVIKVSLEPPQLGKVSVTLRMENDVLHTDFVCSREVAMYIREGIPELASTLAENGISLGESNINTGWGCSSEDPGRDRWESDNSSDDKTAIADIDYDDNPLIASDSRYSYLI